MISEKEMGIEFQKILSKHELHKNLPKFDLVFKEIESLQGIPDFIGLRYLDTNFNFKQIQKMKLESPNNASRLLSLIKKRAPRSEKYLISKSGLSGNSAKRTLNQLVECNIISLKDELNYIISPNFNLPNIEIWSFELKLENWKRAIFQSLRYKTFSNYVVIVFPMERLKTVENNRDIFLNLDIGVMLFDSKTGKYDMIIKPKKCKPSSKVQNLNMMTKLLTQYQSSSRIRYILPKKDF